MSKYDLCITIRDNKYLKFESLYKNIEKVPQALFILLYKAKDFINKNNATIKKIKERLKKDNKIITIKDFAKLKRFLNKQFKKSNNQKLSKIQKKQMNKCLIKIKSPPFYYRSC